VIPRDDLLLEHVLGEGEFGRVLKGMLRSVTGRGFCHYLQIHNGSHRELSS
jgi:hypothetical protein